MAASTRIILLLACHLVVTTAGGAQSKTIRGPKGIVEQQLRVGALQDGTVVDLRSTTFRVNWNGPYGENKPLPPGPILPDQTSKIRIVPNKSLYPVVLGDNSPADITLEGGTFIGVQHRDLTWRVMKLLYDGCGALVQSRGLMTFDDLRIENVMDGIRPRGGGCFLAKGAYARYIRDDFVENDELLAGTIADCLVDGTYVFLSQRPARGEETPPGMKKSDNVTTITNTLVRIMAMPYDMGNTKKGKLISSEGLAPGMLFKWNDAAGSVSVSDCIFYVESVCADGRKSMKFAPGIYRNVTLIWGGDGDYPAPVPEGVTVTGDRTIWEKARENWFTFRHLPVLPEPRVNPRR